MLRIALVVAVAAAASAVASCGNPVESVVSGSWKLEAINGDTVPVVISPPPDSYMMTKGMLLLYPDGSYTYDHAFERRINFGQAVISGKGEQGEWERSGDDITLVNASTGAVVTGRVYGTKMRLS